MPAVDIGMEAPEGVRDSNKVDERVGKSLVGTPFEASTLTLISGGSVNWAYIATLAKPLDDGTKQVFVKHSEKWMKVMPDQDLPLERAVSSPD
jgi:hypothetical protein